MQNLNLQTAPKVSRSVTQGTFLQNYLKICQIVWEEKIFKVFTKANIRLRAPPPSSNILRPINMAWWNPIAQGTFLQNFLKIGQILSSEKKL